MTKLRTHYDNLQVSRTASPEVIRAAYKGLAQKWHPDRNPPERREECTRVMTLINRAYEVLSDPARRDAHDQWIAEQEARIQSTTAKTAGASERSSINLFDTDFHSVTMRLADLPAAAREDLLTAARKGQRGYTSAATATVPGGITRIVIAIVGICIIWFFAEAERWSTDGQWWALGFAFILLYWGASGALNTSTLLREKLAHKILVTPTHLIETDAVTARIWTLLGIKRFQMTVHMRNGSHVGSTIDFQHACGDSTTFDLKRKAEAEVLHAATVKVLAKLDSSLAEYVVALQQSPLFRLATQVPASSRRPSWERTAKSVSIAAVLAMVLHWGVLLPINAHAPTYRGLPPRSAPSVAAPSTGIYPLQSGLTANELLGPEPMPMTGWIRRPLGNSVAPLRIHADADTNCFMKLISGDGHTAATMFLRAGETLDVEVPIGTYRIRFAYGSRWYGDYALFGPETRYAELEGNMTFAVSGSTVEGVEITLTKQVQGNLRDRRLRPEEF